MSRANHSYSQKRNKQNQRNVSDYWDRLCSLPIDLLDRILTITDTEWISLFREFFQTNEGYRKSFVFSKDHRGNRKVQLNDAYPSDFDV